MIDTNYSDAGLIARLAAASTSVKQQLDAATEQESTGKISDSYAGIGAGLRSSLDLRPAEQHLQTWQNNIDAADTRLTTTQSVMTQIASIAQNFYAQTANINNVGTSEVDSIADSAKQALQQVAQLLDTKVGNVYIFSGQDTANPPLTTTDPTALSTALLASDTATAPFSSTIGTAVPTIETGEGQTVQIGLLANQNTLSTSAAPTTGSYMRDVMRALANLASLSSTSTNAQSVAADTRTRLGSAITAMSDEQGVLGDIQSSLTSRKSQLAAVQTAFSTQVSNAEDVDMAATLTKVQTLQTQLQASYQVIAEMKTLSLVNYL